MRETAPLRWVVGSAGVCGGRADARVVFLLLMVLPFESALNRIIRHKSPIIP
jgi:hypothetical protein